MKSETKEELKTILKEAIREWDRKSLISKALLVGGLALAGQYVHDHARDAILKARQNMQEHRIEMAIEKQYGITGDDLEYLRGCNPPSGAHTANVPGVNSPNLALEYMHSGPCVTLQQRVEDHYLRR